MTDPSIAYDSFEFPGFHLPDTPVFSSATGSTCFFGEVTDVTAVLDLGMAFGSRLWGHGLRAIADAADAAPGLGDLLSHELRERACRGLCERVAEELATEPDEWSALVLHTGSEAVETALKTTLRATGRRRMLAFEGGYHGTSGLALAVTTGSAFREPWAAQYASDTVSWQPWGAVPELDEDVACVIVEPWQGRARRDRAANGIPRRAAGRVRRERNAARARRGALRRGADRSHDRGGGQ